MRRFWVLFKMNMKLLLRNKAFLFFLCLVPIVSAMILGIKTNGSLHLVEREENGLIELEHCTDRAVYKSDYSLFTVKVYDASKTELSEYVLEQLADTGMFEVCRCDVSDMTETEVHEQAKKDAFDDRVGTLLYLKKDFDICVLSGDYENALQIYEVSDDERYELFEENITSLLGQIHQLAENAGMTGDMVLEILDTIAEEMPSGESITVSGKDKITLTPEQEVYKSHIGYAFVIITLSFLFCGVCVAHIVIEEQDNMVYTRLMLSRLTDIEYLGSKLAMTVVIAAMQTLILGGCMFFAKDMEFGISKVSFLVIIFFLGLLFSVISFVVGVLIGDVMSSNYVVFAIWTLSGLLAGVFFPLDDTSAGLKAISYLMPQRWFMQTVDMLFVGDKRVYSMILCITVAYLIVIMSVGSIGLKVKRADV